MNFRHARHLFPMLLWAFAPALPLFAGCNALHEDVLSANAGMGEANVSVAAQALSAADISQLTLTVSGPGISSAIVQDLFKTNGQWTGKLGGIPVGGNRTFHADAYDSSGVDIYQGEVTGVTVSKGAPVAVMILLQQSVAPSPFANSAPQISSLVASASQVEQGSTVSLVASAKDPDSDPLTYTWTATGGSFDDPTTATPIWTAPASDGFQTLSVSVTDGKGGQAGISVQVKVASTGQASVTTSFNTWPIVNQVSANPGQLQAGQTTVMDVVANDPDGDPITYAWSDDCGGSFSSTTAQSPTWTAPAGGGSCILTVTVSDGRGGSSSGSLVVGVDLPTVDMPPAIDGDFQSVDTVGPGDQVALSVLASDPEGAALSFSWSASGGTLGKALSTGSKSDVLWTAPATMGSFTITATVEDAAMNQTTRTFHVSVTGACSGTQSYQDLALNPTQAAYPNPLGSDPGWGGGSYPWDILDGATSYPDTWAHGLAFTGGTASWMGQPCGWRQATVDFGEMKTFDRVLAWHHGDEHIPTIFSVEYFNGKTWLPAGGTSSTRFDLRTTSGAGSVPTENVFPPVTGSQVRFILNNCNITHGWIYELQVFGCS